MYSKKELLALPTPALPQNRTGAIFRAEMVRYIVRSRFAKHGRLLIITVFDREAAANGFSAPVAVLYHTKSEYVTLLQKDGARVWRKGRILSALAQPILYARSYPVVCYTEGEEQRIRGFLPTVPMDWHGKDILTLINCYQTDLLNQRNAERKKRRADEVDRFMEIVPKLPMAFDRWLDREPLRHSRYVYYHRTSRRKAACFCTHCKGDFAMEDTLPAHNQAGVCRSCGSEITFKARGIFRKVADEALAAILQRLRGGEYILRFFHVYREFGGHYRNPETSCHETARLFFTSDGHITGQYKYGRSSCTGRCGWYPTKDGIVGDRVTWEVKLGMYLSKPNVWFEDRWLYPHNVRPILDRLGLNYGIQSLVCGEAVNVTTTLLQSIRYPFGHLLAERGMKQLITDIFHNGKTLSSPRRTGKLHQCLGIPKEYLDAAVRNNWSVKDVNWLAEAPRRPSVDELWWLRRQELDYDALNEVAQYATFHRIRRYITAQNRLLTQQIREAKGKKRQPGERRLPYYTDVKSRLIIWRDYLQMAVRVGRDVRKNTHLFPKDLQLEHDVVQQLIQVEMNKTADRRIRALYEPLSRQYGYTGERYFIRPPRSFREFIDEGNYLGHCVARNNYHEGHIAGKSLIFFLRRASQPDTPYYTVELEPQRLHIRQCYGHNHVRATPEVDAFMRDWLAHCEKDSRVQAA